MDYKQVQQQFMAHIRDPDNNDFPDAEDRRLAIYRELFFNNVLGFVSSGFPVLESLYSDVQWQQRVRLFFANHDCETPYFLGIAEEFLHFLAEKYQPTEIDPPYMLELAHYEWVELDLAVKHANHDFSAIVNLADSTSLYLSPLAVNLTYSYPVQYISAENRDVTEVEGGNHLVVYRDEGDDIQFLAVNALTNFMLEIVKQNPSITLEQLHLNLQQALPQFEPDVLKNGAITTLTLLTEKGVIVTK